MTESEAIQKIKRKHCTENQNCTDSCMHGVEHCAYSMAIKALEKQMNDGWIPVEERNPTLFESVYVTCSSLVDERPNWVIEGIYETEGWHGMSYMLSLGEAKVIAWMPKKVPSVYQPKGEKLFDKAECNSRNEAVRKLDGLNTQGAMLDEILSARMKDGKVEGGYRVGIVAVWKERR